MKKDTNISHKEFVKELSTTLAGYKNKKTEEYYGTVWIVDVADSSPCSTVLPGKLKQINISWFCNPKLQKRTLIQQLPLVSTDISWILTKNTMACMAYMAYASLQGFVFTKSF